MCAVFPQSLRFIEERIARLRHEKSRWTEIAMHLNQCGIRRPGNENPWTRASVKDFYLRRIKRHIEVRTVAEVLPEIVQPPKHPGHPVTRADCGADRPCPWATCRYHMAKDLLAAAERRFKSPKNRKIPVSWGREIARGDFTSLPWTCVLDLVGARALVEPSTPLYEALADGEAIGDYLGLSREMVRLNIRSALERIEETNPQVAARLKYAYNISKTGSKGA